MSSAPHEFYSNVQIARKRIFKQYLIWFVLGFLAAGVGGWLVQPFPLFYVWAVCLACGIALIPAPIWRLQRMPCPYCCYPARVTFLPLRHFRCMHCHKSIGEGAEANQKD